MGELGSDSEKYHREIGEFLDDFECDYILTLGEFAKYIKPKNLKTKHFETKEDLVNYIKIHLKEGTNILLKASRFMKFEEIIEELNK